MIIHALEAVEIFRLRMAMLESDLSTGQCGGSVSDQALIPAAANMLTFFRAAEAATSLVLRALACRDQSQSVIISPSPDLLHHIQQFRGVRCEVVFAEYIWLRMHVFAAKVD